MICDCGNSYLTTEELEMKNFYTVWVEGCSKPVQNKYATIEEAKDACRYLIDKKGVKQVYIMKKIGVAEVPSKVNFKMG